MSSVSTIQLKNTKNNGKGKLCIVNASDEAEYRAKGYESPGETVEEPIENMTVPEKKTSKPGKPAKKE
jgi:hypothetical protein